MDPRTVLWTALATVPRASPAGLKRFARLHGGVVGLADAVDAGAPDPEGTVDARYATPAALRRIEAGLTPAALRRAERRVRAWTADGTGLLHPEHPRYPPLLGAIHDPPPLLFEAGRLPPTASAPPERARSVAVVGTRRATPWGERFAERLARRLAEAGVVVVSGLALGIDGAAHRGALNADGGRTVAVLGSALDRVHPAAHRPLARRAARAGAVLSEHPPGTNARPGFFPRRNRIVAGLARTVVVVEAPERSGALITAAFALEEGRDVAVVPRRPDARVGRGVLALLREGAATPIGSADDLLADLDWTVPKRTEPDPPDPLQRELLARLRERGDGGLPPAPAGAAPDAVLAALTELELAGRVRRDGAGGWRVA